VTHKLFGMLTKIMIVLEFSCNWLLKLLPR